MRKYKFFAHFNRINMQRGSSRVWTVHFRGTCYQVEGIDFHCGAVYTRYRPEARQPRAVIVGEAQDLRVVSGVARLT